MENEEKQNLENSVVSGGGVNEAGSVFGGEEVPKIEGVENVELLESGSVENATIQNDVESRSSESETASEKYESFASGMEQKISGNGVTGLSYSSGDSAEEPGVLSRTKNKPFIIVGAFFLIVVLLIGAYYALGVLRGGKVGLVSNEDGGVIVKSAIDKMGTVESYDYNGSVKLSFDMQEDELYSQNKISANYNFTDNGSVETAADGMKNMYGKYNLSGNFGGNSSGEDKNSTFSGELELALIDKMIYAKLNQVDFSIDGVDDSAEKKQIDSFVEIFKNNWYYLSPEEFSAMSSEESAQIWNSMNLGDKIKDYSLLKFSSDLGDENIGGVDTYHYVVKMDVEEAARFVLDVMKESAKNSSEEDEKSFSKYLDENTKNIENAKKALNFVMNNINSEVWIGKDDGLIHRLKITGSFDEQFVKDYAKAMSEEGEYNEQDMNMFLNANFEVDYTFLNFGGAKVNKPENAKDLKKVLEGMYSNLSSSAMIDDSVDTDGDGLSDTAESFYGSDINNPDTDGDGYKDGNEVDNGYDPIVAGSAKLDFDKLLGN